MALAVRLLELCALFLLAAGQLHIEKLPHGVLQQNLGLTKHQSAVWKIFIQVDFQDRWKIEHSIWSDFLKAHELVKEGVIYRPDYGMWNSMFTRLQVLQQKIDEFSSVPTYMGDRKRNRRPRGLINIIGKAAKGLFGLATEGDIQEVRNLMNQMSEQNSHVAHAVNKLITVVNSNSDILEQHAKKINELIRHISGAVMLINQHFNLTRTLERELALVKFAGQLDLAIASLEATVNLHYDFVTSHLQQRLACEGTWFQETLLDPTH